MNSLFLAGLTLFLAQGLAGRDNRSSRMIAMVTVGATAAAFFCSL